MSLELNNLSIGYTTGKAVAAAITATAAEGRLTCLLGANGMGKSTLLRTMAGFMPPLGGSIAINGTDTSRLPAHRMARQVSVVLTLPSATGNLSVREMVAMGRTPYTNFWGKLSHDDRKAVDEALSMAGIAHLADRKLYAVSDGERQKAMIAKSLAQQTPVLLLDEPTRRRCSCRPTTSNWHSTLPTTSGCSTAERSPLHPHKTPRWQAS